MHITRLEMCVFFNFRIVIGVKYTTPSKINTEN